MIRRLSVMKPVGIAAVCLLALLAASRASAARQGPAGSASPPGGRFALLVEGASGEEQYAKQHRAWLDGLTTVLRDRFKYDAAHLVVLAEQPKAGEERATADAVRAALARLASSLTPNDQLVIVLIGHGSAADASAAKFNLVGPDLAVADWAALLKEVRARTAIVDTTSASAPYLTGLAAPGRVVITATASAAQRFHTVFPDGFVKAFSDTEADLDKDGRISLLEAFTYASRTVKEHFERGGTMATETAMIDDDGDGKGRTATATGPDGAVAALTFLETPVVATSSDPETQRLLTRQQALTDQIDDLRRRRTSMPTDVYDRELEPLVTELAIVSQQVRQKTAR